MTAFNQSWDLLKATVYRGTAAPHGLGNPDNELYHNWHGMLSDQPGSGVSDPGFLTTQFDYAHMYANERDDMMDHAPEYIPYVIQYEADTDPDKVFYLNQMTDQELEQITQSLMGLPIPHPRSENVHDPQDFLKNPSRTVQNTDDANALLQRYVHGLNAPGIHTQPTRWEANLEAMWPLISEWGEKVEDAIADLGKYYVGYDDVFDHDTFYSLRRDPSFKLVARHML